MNELNTILLKATTLQKNIRDLKNKPIDETLLENSLQKKLEVKYQMNTIISDYTKFNLSKIASKHSIELFQSYEKLSSAISTFFSVDPEPQTNYNYKTGFKISIPFSGFELKSTLFFAPIIDNKEESIKIILSEIPILEDPTGGIITKKELLKQSLIIAETIQNELQKIRFSTSSFAEFKKLSHFQLSHVICSNGFRFLAFDKTIINSNISDYHTDSIIIGKEKLFKLLSTEAKKIDPAAKFSNFYKASHSTLTTKIKLKKSVKEKRHCAGGKMKYYFDLDYEQYLNVSFHSISHNRIRLRVKSNGTSGGGAQLRDAQGVYISMARCSDKIPLVNDEWLKINFGYRYALENINHTKSFSLKNITIINDPYFSNNSLIINFK